MRTHFHLMTLLIGTGAIAACADTPTQPAHIATAATVHSTITPTAMTPALALVLRDAAVRLTGGLTSADAQQRLRAMFTTLDARIDAGDVNGASAQIALVRRELLSERGTTDAADRDAIALSLDDVQRSLVAPPTISR